MDTVAQHMDTAFRSCCGYSNTAHVYNILKVMCLYSNTAH